MQQTSLKAWESIKPIISNRQLQIYEKLKELGQATNAMLSHECNLPINCVTPRVYELRQNFMIKFSKQDKCPITGNTAIFWESRCKHL